MSLLERVKQRHQIDTTERYTLDEYLNILKTDAKVYRTAAERILDAIGEPEIIDTSKDSKLGRIFSNRVIRRYKVFKDFYGMENTIEKIVSYFRHSAQGLEEKKQVLYLLGPVGSAKSSLAEKLKKLVETQPIYVLTANGITSPVFETPLGLFAKEDASELNVPEHYLNERLSPWAIKRLKEFEGDVTKFTVTKMYPSQSNQIAVSKTEPGDENNQDISTLVGKIDIKKLAKYSQNDPDAYSYSGGLCLSNQGLLEFVEMFKAPIKVLHPLLTATQEGNYNGTEAISSIPFDGIILAHSNQSEWEEFRNNKNNEAFIDRINIVKIPYVLRVSEEIKIYKKLIDNSNLKVSPCAPETLSLLAKFSILTRLKDAPGQDLHTKLLVYDGENIKEQDPKAKSAQEYIELAGVEEGMGGISTRFAYKTLSKVFNFDSREIAANPVHLFYVLEQQLEQEGLPIDTVTKYKAFIEKHLIEKYKKFIEKELNTAYLESADEFGQNLFDRYVKYADFWIQDTDYRDPETGELFSREMLEKELEKIEKADSTLTLVKDFRNEIVNFVLRAEAKTSKKVDWKSYPKLKNVIEKNMFQKIEDLLPIITFNTKDSKDNQKKHTEFLERMMTKGYTEIQVRLLVEWFIKSRKS